MRDATKRRITPLRLGLRSRVVVTVVATALATMVAGCGGSADPTPAGSAFNDLYQQAKATNGGKIALYTHLSGTDQQAAIKKAFEAAYPGLDLEVTGLNGQQLLTRFETEKQSGQNHVDVIQYAGTAPFTGTFKEQDLIEPFTPADASHYKTEGTFIEGYAYPWCAYELSAVYNPTMVSDEDKKKLETYQGWADPTWKGRAAIAEPNGGTYLRGWDYWVAQDTSLGKDWLKAIKDNVDPVVFSDGNSAANQVQSGEYAVAFGVNSVTAVRAALKGAPVELSRQEYTVVVPALMGLVSKAPNAPGGKLFINWQLSEAGQKASQDATGNLSVRDDLIGVPPNGVENWPKPNKQVSNDEKVVTATQKDLTTYFTQLFGAGQ
ncbi:extracellular solute-binding protein [Micromonospora sp. NPDC005161]